jgi:hypothetical protein
VDEAIALTKASKRSLTDEDDDENADRGARTITGKIYELIQKHAHDTNATR